MIPATFPDIPVNGITISIVQGWATWPSRKKDILDAVLKQYSIRPALMVIGATFPGWAWDRAIETHILTVITYVLRSKDANRVPYYQCWPAGGGEYFWEPFSSFDLTKLQTLKQAATTRKRQAELAEYRIDLWIDYLKKVGPAATTASVYAAVVGDPRWK